MKKKSDYQTLKSIANFNQYFVNKTLGVICEDKSNTKMIQDLLHQEHTSTSSSINQPSSTTNQLSKTHSITTSTSTEKSDNTSHSTQISISTPNAQISVDKNSKKSHDYLETIFNQDINPPILVESLKVTRNGMLYYQ